MTEKRNKTSDMMLSILIDTYNHERFIRTALESVFAQTWCVGRCDFEIIVVDDGSTDETPNILAQFAERINIVSKPNGGQASAFNEGLRRCSGDNIAFLDGDDWWHPEKLERVMAAFEAAPELVAVGHGITIVDELAETSVDSHPDRAITLDFKTQPDPVVFHRNMSFLGTSRLTAKRKSLDSVGLVPTSLTYEADEYFFTLLPAYGKVAILPMCLTYYRLHGGNLYQASGGLARDALTVAKIKKRAGIFACLMQELPPALAGTGLAPRLISHLLEPTSIAAERLRLEVGGGSRWETFRTETMANRHNRDHHRHQNSFVKAVTLVLTLLLRPPTFYAIRQRYAYWRLRRL